MIWKVREKTSGLFVQRGTYFVSLSKIGTVWKRASDLTQSINNGLFNKLTGSPNLEVVIYELVETSKHDLDHHGDNPDKWMNK